MGRDGSAELRTYLSPSRLGMQRERKAIQGSVFVEDQKDRIYSESSCDDRKEESKTPLPRLESKVGFIGKLGLFKRSLSTRTGGAGGWERTSTQSSLY